jgi:hypothetical protein
MAEEEAADTLQTIVETGTLDDDSRAALTKLCENAVDRFLKEHPEASLAEH